MKYKYYIFAIILIIIAGVIGFLACKYNNTKDKKSVIPLDIYQTWHTKDLPPSMRESVNKLKSCNPEFTHHLFDDEDCREFIKEHFSSDVLYAFDKLKPSAYKSDLWRYCVLYINGGIYLDIKYHCVGNFKLINLTDKEYFVRDRVVCNNHGIYNAFLVCKPKNEIMLKCIHQIIQNVRNKYYGKTSIHPTGPMMMQDFFTQSDIISFDMEYTPTMEHDSKNRLDIIKYRGKNILTSYIGYREEQNKYSINEHYSILWKNKDIYN